MEENLYAPRQILQKYIKVCIGKVSNSLWKTVLLGIMAGAFISVGASASSVSMYGIAEVGIARTVGGVVFPIGLMLILLIGGELFTGNCLIVIGILDKRYTVSAMVKNLIIVFFSNLAGAVFTALLVTYSGQFGFSDNALGAYVIKVAIAKSAIDSGTIFISAILCNIIVCAAVFMAAGAKDVTGKILGTFFPIFVFVICGFEHCVANMYYISAGIFAARNESYAVKAVELYGFTQERLRTLNWINMFTDNLVPATLGNIVGGALFVGVPLYFLYREKKGGADISPHKTNFPIRKEKIS